MKYALYAWGLGAIVWGVWLVSIPAALVVGGFFLVVVAANLGKRR